MVPSSISSLMTMVPMGRELFVELRAGIEVGVEVEVEVVAEIVVEVEAVSEIVVEVEVVSEIVVEIKVVIEVEVEVVIEVESRSSLVECTAAAVERTSTRKPSEGTSSAAATWWETVGSSVR